MAILKTLEQPNGTVATYHRIIRGTVDFTTGYTTIEWESYLDKAARDAGKRPITAGSVIFESMPSWSGDPRLWAYAELKARPEWIDAQDA